MKAIFPGYFDPITLGHLDIIEVASKIFEVVFVLISNNSDKKSFFSLDERILLVNKAVSKFSNIEVVFSSGDKLTVDLASNLDSDFIIRGVRGDKDFEYEMYMTFINSKLDSNKQTIFIPSKQCNLHISSSVARELIIYTSSKRDLLEYLPEPIIDEIFKIKGRKI